MQSWDSQKGAVKKSVQLFWAEKFPYKRVGAPFQSAQTLRSESHTRARGLRGKRQAGQNGQGGG